MAKKKVGKAKVVSSGLGGIANVAPAPTPAATAPAPTPAPAAPARVDPFFTAEDLAAINDFNTAFFSNVAALDFGVTQLTSDTTFQKTQNDQRAKVNTNEAADIMTARGLFSSSVKDAAIYDIEAHRSLANKFLDDKLIEAQTNAGTQKKILADSKTRFDEAMTAKQVQNAQGVNDNSAAAWADAMATWVPAAAPASKAKAPGAAPAKPAKAASAPVPDGKKLVGTAKPGQTVTGFGGGYKPPKAPKPPKPKKPS